MAFHTRKDTITIQLSHSECKKLADYFNSVADYSRSVADIYTAMYEQGFESNTPMHPLAHNENPFLSNPYTTPKYSPEQSPPQRSFSYGASSNMNMTRDTSEKLQAAFRQATYRDICSPKTPAMTTGKDIQLPGMQFIHPWIGNKEIPQNDSTTFVKQLGKNLNMGMNISSSQITSGDDAGTVEMNSEDASEKGKRHLKIHKAASYNTFATEIRPKVKKENPELSHYEVSRMIGKLWKELSDVEKEHYIEIGKEKLAKSYHDLQIPSPEELRSIKMKARSLKRKHSNENSPNKSSQGSTSYSAKKVTTGEEKVTETDTEKQEADQFLSISSSAESK